ncbi:pesticin C-terminus-like muramidase, partial [Vibrio cholerae]
SLPTMMPSSANNTANDESVAEEKTPERILKSDLLKPSDELEKLAKRQASAYRQGNHSDEVKLLQEALIKLGFDLGKAGADGDFGSKTKTAIEQFQKSYQPSHQTHPSYSIGPVDGIVGKGTLLALDEALMDGWVYENDEMDLKWLTVPKGQLTFDAEGNDVEGDLYFSRVIHWPGNNSGITIGRGYDLGQQERVLSELNDARVDPELVSWLVSAQGLKGNDAHDFYNQIPNNIRYKGITRKQQYMLFNYTYKLMEKDVARICMKIDTLKAYHFDSSISPSDAWDSIPQIIKDVLIDLRYRGDYTPKSRRIIQRSSYKGDIDEFKKIISTKENWVNVPHDRFERRKMYVE